MDRWQLTIESHHEPKAHKVSDSVVHERHIDDIDLWPFLYRPDESDSSGLFFGCCVGFSWSHPRPRPCFSKRIPSSVLPTNASVPSVMGVGSVRSAYNVKDTGG